MKIAVVGSEGQIAHSLRILGRARGLYVFSAGRPEVDLTRPQSVGEFLDRIKPDLVVNAAAYTAVDKAENDSEQAFLVNATGAGEVARLCSQINRPLVHISTDFVFDGSSRTPYVETDAVLPLNVYGASKAAGEVAVRRALVQNIIIRTAWVYGAHGGNFVKTMLRLGAERPELSVVDDQRGSPTSAADIADAILQIAPRLVANPEPSLWGTYHLTGATRDDVARFRRGNLSSGRCPRRHRSAPESHHDGGVSHPRAPSRLFSSRQYEVRLDVWLWITRLARKSCRLHE